MLSEGEEGSNHSQYYYDTAAYEAGTCHLDQCNGRWDSATGAFVGYFTTENYPFVPICRWGDKHSACGFDN